MNIQFETPIQLTFDDYGHTLHHCQIESHDGKYLVFDTRNDDTKIGETGSIKILNTETNQIKTIYTTQNQTEFGPGVGAATFSPNENKVIFIHGIRNCNEIKPYSATRRTGVAINLNYPKQPIFMDARDVIPPFTDGALRGGTHSHSWKKDKGWISFTYNDYILEQQSKINSSIKDQRVVGIMFPKKVEVPLDNHFENNCGEMFSVLISEVVTNAEFGSDQIEKAFDECWINNSNNIAFQGHVRDEKGNLKTEIFITEIPDSITIDSIDNLKGTCKTLPSVPKCIHQFRLTKTSKGISELRHWLRSSPKGDIIYFLAEDNQNITQLYGIKVKSGIIEQYTFHDKSIDSPFNISSNGKYAIYFSQQEVWFTDLSEKNSKKVYNSSDFNNRLTGIPSFSLDGKKIYFNQYVNKNSENFIQIFEIKIIIQE